MERNKLPRNIYFSTALKIREKFQSIRTKLEERKTKQKTIEKLRMPEEFRGKKDPKENVDGYKALMGV